MCTKVFYEKGSFSRSLMVDVKKLPSISGQCLAEKVSSIIENLKVIGLCGRDIVTGNHSAKLNLFPVPVTMSDFKLITLQITRKIVTKPTCLMTLYMFSKTLEITHQMGKSLYFQSFFYIANVYIKFSCPASFTRNGDLYHIYDKDKELTYYSRKASK